MFSVCIGTILVMWRISTIRYYGSIKKLKPIMTMDWHKGTSWWSLGAQFPMYLSRIFVICAYTVALGQTISCLQLTSRIVLFQMHEVTFIINNGSLLSPKSFKKFAIYRQIGERILFPNLYRFNNATIILSHSAIFWQLHQSKRVLIYYKSKFDSNLNII